MPPQTYFLVSLPASIAASGDPSEALTTLRSAVQTDNGTTYPFNIPGFKIGTLDALVNQADELAKLEQGCKGVVDKVADSLRTILEGDEDKIQEQKVVNDSMPPWLCGGDLPLGVHANSTAQDQQRTTSNPSNGTKSNTAPTNP